ncbi:MAG TPA: erythromycin esterase family protein [Steroidobacteraceae bacterium]
MKARWFLLLLLTAAAVGDAGPVDFAACASRYATPQATVESQTLPGGRRYDGRTDDLAPLLSIVGDARVFALGEPGHGAHEPLALRNRMFEYLVEHGGFTAVAIETSFTESRALHEFVAGRAVDSSGDVRTMVRRDLSWGFGGYVENVELIQWLHDYNTEASHAHKVSFYGIDLSGADNQDGFSHARDAIDQALRALARIRPALAERFRVRLAPSLQLFSDRDYHRLSSREDVELEQDFGAIAAALQHDKVDFIAQSGKEEFEWALRDIIMAQRLQAVFRVTQPRSEGAAMLPGDYKLVNIRDAAMADNVQWVLRQEGAGARLLLFAHDAHVMNESSRGGIWSVFAQPPQMMGQHLRRELRDGLVTVGTLVQATRPGLPVSLALPDSVEDALAGLNQPLFLLDLHKAACSPATVDWLSKRHPIHANFDTELDIVPGSAFDAVEFVATAGAAHAN